MLRKRLIASFFMITPVLVIFWLDSQYNFGFPGFWSVPAIVLASVTIVSELSKMSEGHSVTPTLWVSYLGVIACQFAVISPELLGTKIDRWFASCAVLVSAAICAFIHEMLRYDGKREAFHRVGVTLLTVVYAGWFLSFLAATRVVLENDKGAFALFSILFIIKLSDAGAYFVGKRWGRRKLAPILSPGKTIEGLFGGILAAMLAAAIAFRWLMPWGTGEQSEWAAVFGYAISICLIGVVGDLSESLIKRDLGHKDSSGWLPGLGGIMDTADSVILAAPVAYLWWQSGLL